MGKKSQKPNRTLGLRTVHKIKKIRHVSSWLTDFNRFFYFFYFVTVCDDHHFKDEGLFFRFKNDEKLKSPRLRDRLNSKKGSKYNKEHREEDAGSTGDQNENRESGGSWDSSVASDPHTPQGTPDLDE